MDAHFSQRVNDIHGYSKEEAIRLGNNHISPEHLFLGILREGEGVAVDILLNNGVDLLMLKGSIEKSIKADKPVAMADNEILPLLKSTERVLRLGHIEAKAMKTKVIDTEHLLMAILRDESNLVTRFLAELDIDYMLVKKAVYA
jgi:ATP-dependent Clp protease ATP-binding subunit ClpC